MLGKPSCQDVRADIVCMLVEAVRSRSPRDEFWECRFWTCLDRRAHSLLRNFRVSEHVDVRLGDVEWNVPAESVNRTDFLAARSIVEGLPEPMRTAFWLRHYDGLQTENTGPMTIGAMMGVSGRMVRKYIEKADRMVAERREG